MYIPQMHMVRFSQSVHELCQKKSVAPLYTSLWFSENSHPSQKEAPLESYSQDSTVPSSPQTSPGRWLAPGPSSISNGQRKSSPPGFWEEVPPRGWLAEKPTPGFPLSRRTASAERMGASAVQVTGLAVPQWMKATYSCAVGAATPGVAPLCL